MAELKPKVIGHRGNRLAAPENTIESFHQCLIDQRIDGIELDTWNNDFGLLPVIHDADVNTTTNGTGAISRLKASQIAPLRCRFAGKVTEEGIPNLTEVLKLVSDANRNDFLINIEMKALPEDGDLREGETDNFAKNIGSLMQSFPTLNVVVSSFDHRRVVNLKKYFPEVKIAFLQEGLTMPQSLTSYSAEFGFAWWNLKYSSISPAKVNAAREAGAKVAAWTVNEPSEWLRLIHCEVAAIITDRPHELAKFLDSSKP